MFDRIKEGRPGATEFVSCNLCGLGDGIPVLKLRDNLHDAKGEFEMVKCPGCGLFYLNPRPSESEIYRHYPSHYYSYEIQGPISVQKKFSGFRGGLKRQIFMPKSSAGLILRALFVIWSANWRWFYAADSENKKKTFLELGCGSGQTLLFFKEFGWDVTGVDLSPAAEKTGAAQGLKIFQGDLTRLDLPEKSFDLIWMWHTFGHVRNPRAVLEKARKLLKQEGRIVMQLPVADALLPWLFGTFSPVWDAPRHLFIFTEQTLRRLAGETGYECRVLSRSASQQTVLVSLSYLAKKFVPKARIPDGVKKLFNLPISFLTGILQILNLGEVLSVELSPKEML